MVVGPKEALSTRIVPVREINWLGDAPLQSRDEWPLSVKVRSTRPPREAILRPTGPDTAEVELFTPEEGVSPGRPACSTKPKARGSSAAAGSGAADPSTSARRARHYFLRTGQRGARTMHKKVVIVGGGYVGTELAQSLGPLLPM